MLLTQVVPIFVVVINSLFEFVLLRVLDPYAEEPSWTAVVPEAGRNDASATRKLQLP